MIPETQAEQATACIREINQALAQAEVKLLLAHKRLTELGAVLADVQQLQQRPIQQPSEGLILLLSGAYIDPRQKAISRGETTVNFTRRCWDLITLLLQGPKSNAEILLALWGGAADENTARKTITVTRQAMALVGADSDLARLGAHNTSRYQLLVAS